jgi:hypothetical protein
MGGGGHLVEEVVTESVPLPLPAPHPPNYLVDVAVLLQASGDFLSKNKALRQAVVVPVENRQEQVFFFNQKTLCQQGF